MGNEKEDLIPKEHTPNRELKTKIQQSKLSIFLFTVIFIW
jgi:hypothetical protein